MSICHRVFILLFVLLTVTPRLSHAESTDLASVVPAGTLVFISRGGGEGLQDAVAKTSFGKLLAVPEVKKLMEFGWQTLDETITEATSGDPDEASSYEQGKKCLAIMERSPVAFALIDFVLNKKRKSVARCALIIQSGDETDAFVSAFREFLDAEDSPKPKPIRGLGVKAWMIPGDVEGGLYFGTHKGFFIITIGKSAISEFKKCLDGKIDPLKSDRLFDAARAKINGDEATRAWTMYVNVEKTLQRGKRLLKNGADGSAENYRHAFKITELLGLNGLSTMIWERHYKEGGVWSAMYVAYRENTNSGDSVFPGEALDREALLVIPESSTWATAFRVSIPAAYDTAMRVIQTVDSELRTKAQSSIDGLSKTLGFDFVDDFLKLLSGTIVMYGDDSAGIAVPFGSTAFLLKSPNAEKLRARIRDIAAGMSHTAGKKSMKLSNLKHEGVEIDTVALNGIPLAVMPSWTAHNDWLVVGLAPQAVTAAIDRLNLKNPATTSLIESKRFRKYCDHVGEIGSSLSYVDLRSTIGDAYPLANMGLQMAAAQAGANGSTIPQLPPFDALSEHVFPDITVTRADKYGSLTTSYGPLPFNAGVGSPTSIATVAMATSILLPSLSRARELSKRTVCAANMRGIIQGMYIHAQDDQMFPENFQILIEEEYTTPKMFVCPSSTCEEGDLECCYIYIPGQGTVDHPRNVVLYEKTDAHLGEGCNVMFQDSHVEFVTPYSRVEELVKETKARLAKRKGRNNDSDSEDDSTQEEE